MSRREAFETALSQARNFLLCRRSFEAGYAAALAEVKAGGPTYYQRKENGVWTTLWDSPMSTHEHRELYVLPEDVTPEEGKS
jgi:hypothetical protein